MPAWICDGAANGLPFAGSEGFAGGPWLLASAADEGEGWVTDFGQGLRSRSGADPAGILAAGILAAGDITKVKEAVFDLPMIA